MGKLMAKKVPFFYGSLRPCGVFYLSNSEMVSLVTLTCRDIIDATRSRTIFLCLMLGNLILPIICQRHHLRV